MEKGTNTPRGRVRYFVAFMSFIICTLMNVHRMVMAVGIVAMVKQKHLSGNVQHNYSKESCPVPKEFENATVFNIEGDLDWSPELQGYVLGVSSFAYIFSQLPAGRLAETWGAKKTLFAGNLMSAFFTFVTPMATWWNVYAVMAAQLMRGLAQGVCLPPVFVLMSKWFPRQERGFLSTLVTCGFGIGATVGGVTTGWLCDVPQLGWQSAFYIEGFYAAIMSLIFAYVVYETPQSHPTITAEELKYITEGQECDLTSELPPTPWKKMLTSVPVYALFFALFGHYWSVNYFLSVHPTYMGTILHFSMTKNGAASTIPISFKCAGGVAASFLTNCITKNKCISVDKLRKSLNFVGAFGFSACLLGAYWANCDTLINIICFTFSLFCSGIALSGAQIACGDMSPRFCGTLMGIAATVASTSTFIIPVMAGYLTKDQTIEEWHIVFFVSIAVVFSSGVIFSVFGSAEIQPWNDPESQDSKNTSSEHYKCENKESFVTRF